MKEPQIIVSATKGRRTKRMQREKQGEGWGNLEKLICKGFSEKGMFMLKLEERDVTRAGEEHFRQRELYKQRLIVGRARGLSGPHKETGVAGAHERQRVWFEIRAWKDLPPPSPPMYPYVQGEFCLHLSVPSPHGLLMRVGSANPFQGFVLWPQEVWEGGWRRETGLRRGKEEEQGFKDRDPEAWMSAKAGVESWEWRTEKEQGVTGSRAVASHRKKACGVDGSLFSLLQRWLKALSLCFFQQAIA